MKPTVSIVVAISSIRGLATDGNGRARWYMPDDLKRVRKITLGHPIIIGSKTFQGILDTLGKPLPERTNIVINPLSALPAGCYQVASLEAGMTLAKELDPDEIFIMGDEALYAEAFPYVTKLYLTIVSGDHLTTETFPDYSDFSQTYEEPGGSGGFTYTHQVLCRNGA